MPDHETIYATQPDDSDDSWRRDYATEDPLQMDREWDALMAWERANGRNSRDTSTGDRSIP